MVPSDNQHAVHLQQEDEKVSSVKLLHKYAVINLGFVVPLDGHEGFELPVALLGSLLQSVKALP